MRRRHVAVHGTDPTGLPYAAADPHLLRWVHLAFSDAFLAAHAALGQDLTGRFGRRWADIYLAKWQRSAHALGADDLPTTRAELAEAIAAQRPLLEPVPPHLRAFLSAAPGLTAPERLCHTGLARSAALLLSPTLAPLAGVPGRTRHSPRQRAQLHRTGLQLRALQLALGPLDPAEQAARYGLGTGPRPGWLDTPTDPAPPRHSPATPPRPRDGCYLEAVSHTLPTRRCWRTRTTRALLLLAARLLCVCLVDDRP